MILMHVTKIGGGLKDNLAKAGVAALNKTGKSSRAEMVRQTRKRYNVTAKRVRAGIYVRRASRSRLNTEVLARGRRMGLQHFRPRWKPGQPIGATVEVIRGRRTTIRGAFTMQKSGAKHVFRRVGPSRLPIKRLVAGSVPGMLRFPAITEALLKFADLKLSQNLTREISWRVEKGKI